MAAETASVSTAAETTSASMVAEQLLPHAAEKQLLSQWLLNSFGFTHQKKQLPPQRQQNSSRLNGSRTTPALRNRNSSGPTVGA